jgi:hypothetical protein
MPVCITNGIVKYVFLFVIKERENLDLVLLEMQPIKKE